MFYLSIRAVEYVERAVILLVFDIFCIVFHLHLHCIPIIILTDFEFLVPELLLQSLWRQTHTLLMHRFHCNGNVFRLCFLVIL